MRARALTACESRLPPLTPPHPPCTARPTAPRPPAKAPTKLAKSKKRWFQMDNDEIRYFAKVDGSKQGVDGSLKGAIRLAEATTARAEG